MSDILLLSASAIFLIAFGMYNKGVIAGRHTPPIAGWGVFSLIAAVNSVTYLGLTKHRIDAVVLFTDFFVCFVTVIILLLRARSRVVVDETDKKIALMSLIAVLIWQVTRAVWQETDLVWVANLFNQIAYTSAFVPS